MVCRNFFFMPWRQPTWLHWWPFKIEFSFSSLLRQSILVSIPWFVSYFTDYYNLKYLQWASFYEIFTNLLKTKLFVQAPWKKNNFWVLLISSSWSCIWRWLDPYIIWLELSPDGLGFGLNPFLDSFFFQPFYHMNGNCYWRNLYNFSILVWASLTIFLW